MTSVRHFWARSLPFWLLSAGRAWAYIGAGCYLLLSALKIGRCCADLTVLRPFSTFRGHRRRDGDGDGDGDGAVPTLRRGQRRHGSNFADCEDQPPPTPHAHPPPLRTEVWPWRCCQGHAARKARRWPIPCPGRPDCSPARPAPTHGPYPPSITHSGLGEAAGPCCFVGRGWRRSERGGGTARLGGGTGAQRLVGHDRGPRPAGREPVEEDRLMGPEAHMYRFLKCL